MPKHTMTAEEARQLFSYNPETGDLIWKRTKNRAQKGTIAGTLSLGGYIVVGVNRNYYKAHRIIWLMEHGDWPEFNIDHIDGNGANNRLDNLRQATQADNCKNSRIRRDNSCGFKGVMYRTKYKNKWRARIQVNGKRKDLGHFATPEEAHAAYCKAAAELHGEFANFG